MSIRNSRKDKFVLLKCDLGGSYRDARDKNIAENRKRSTGTHLIECPFSIKGKNGGDGVWVFEAIDLTHNHEPSTDMSGHSSVDYHQKKYKVSKICPCVEYPQDKLFLLYVKKL